MRLGVLRKHSGFDGAIPSTVVVYLHPEQLIALIARERMFVCSSHAGHVFGCVGSRGLDGTVLAVSA